MKINGHEYQEIDATITNKERAIIFANISNWSFSFEPVDENEYTLTYCRETYEATKDDIDNADVAVECMAYILGSK